MTMRMEATPEEPGRRDQTLDAGAETVVALYRLGRVAQMHDPSNQAYSRQIDQTQQAVVDYCSRAGRFFSVLFAPSATFVGGELLRGARATQEFATELGSLLEARGISEIIITKDVSPEDLLDLSRLLAPDAQAPPFANARIRVRAVEDVARVRGLAIEHLPIDRRIARTYGEAIVSVRRLFDELLAGRYVLQPRIKRIAQSLVELAAAQNPFFVGVTETRPSESDEAVRAVHAAFLSAAMARELGADRRKSVEIVLAALLHDVALPRIRSRAVEQTGRTGEAPEADTELPAGTAATLAAFCGLHEHSMPRAVVAFESQWSGFTGPLGAVYHGARPPTLQARIVAVAHQWTRIRAASGPTQARSLDEAVAALLEDLQDASDFAVARLLVATLRFYPAGTVLELDTGEIAEVVDGRDVGNGSPLVRITIDAEGCELAQPTEVDLAATRPAGAARNIVGVRSVDGWRRLERATTPAAVPKPTTRGDVGRGSLPSISPGMLDGLSSGADEDFIHVLRTELNDQLSDPALPREKSTPNLDEAAAKAMARARGDTGSHPSVPPASGSTTTTQTPSARGSLATTPLVHVLVYLLDHGITGSVELVEPDGVTHVIYVRKGAPVKVKTGRVVAPLAELLAQSGKLALDRVPELVATAEREGILLGESLVARSLISRGQLWSALEVQIPLKLERLANLPPETKYVLYKDKNLLERWGGADAVAADPIHVIHCVVRRWHDRARVRATLDRLSKHPLIVRADAKIGGLKLTPEERAVLDAIRGQCATVGVLQHMRLAEGEALSSLVYTLAITRQLDLPSQRKQVGPMGLRSASLPAPPPRLTAPPSSNPASSRSASQPDAVPLIAEAIASALSVPPPEPPHGSSEVEIAPSLATPPELAPLTGTMQSPLSSTSGIPPVSSSRERVVDSSSRRGGAPAHSPLSSTAMRASLTSEALDAADRSLEAMGRFRLADAALQKGDHALAERLAEEAITLDPEPVEYRAMLIWVRAQSSGADQLPSLVGAMTDFLVEQPDHPRVLLYRARLLAKQGRTREAIADYEAHLRSTPKNTEALAELSALR